MDKFLEDPSGCSLATGGRDGFIRDLSTLIASCLEPREGEAQVSKARVNSSQKEEPMNPFLIDILMSFYYIF